MTSSVCCYDGELLSLVSTFQMGHARGRSSKGRLAPANSHSVKPGCVFVCFEPANSYIDSSISSRISLSAKQALEYGSNEIRLWHLISILSLGVQGRKEWLAGYPSAWQAEDTFLDPVEGMPT
jgi:hypothetical protein